ncbi:hypothetical protein PG999_007879 [Apiospora kogelbergensis]|uniref:Uncharacterized protein n=1 Tax=Apiospora kogelbergensis TaxID=1337665 RepID=A0AAW0QND8_9PEZI
MEHPLIDLISQVFLPEVTSTPTIEIPSGNGTSVTLNLSLPSNVAVHGSLTGSPICFDTYNPAGRYDKIKDGISYLRNTGPFCIATYRPDAIIYQRVSCS